MWVPANSSKYFIEPSRGRLGAPAPHGKGKFGPNWLRTLPSDRKVLIPAAFALASLILIQCPSSIIGFALPTGARVEDVSHGQLLARTVKRSENRKKEDDTHCKVYAAHNGSPFKTAILSQVHRLYLIINVTFAPWTRLPLVPLMVSVYVPTGACRLGDIFSVEVPEPTTDLGLKLELVRTGNPLTLKFTVPEKPP